MIPMDKKIQKVVKLFSYPVWFVIRDEKVDCPCVNFSTKQADSQCKKCLGTGKKIRLVRENAAHQNDYISQRGKGLGYSEKTTVGEYYSLKPVEVKPEDLIIDGENVDVVQRVDPERTNHNDPVYYRYVTSPKKSFASVILKNFKELLKGFSHG